VLLREGGQSLLRGGVRMLCYKFEKMVYVTRRRKGANMLSVVGNGSVRKVICYQLEGRDLLPREGEEGRNPVTKMRELEKETML
jgi:hypothetical protein